MPAWHGNECVTREWGIRLDRGRVTGKDKEIGKRVVSLGDQRQKNQASVDERAGNTPENHF